MKITSYVRHLPMESAPCQLSQIPFKGDLAQLLNIPKSLIIYLPYIVNGNSAISDRVGNMINYVIGAHIRCYVQV